MQSRVIRDIATHASISIVDPINRVYTHLADQHHHTGARARIGYMHLFTSSLPRAQIKTSLSDRKQVAGRRNQQVISK